MYVFLLVKFVYLLNPSNAPPSQGFQKLKFTKITLVWNFFLKGNKSIWSKSKWHLKSSIFIVIRLIIIPKKPKNQFNYLFRRQKIICYNHEKCELDQSDEVEIKPVGKLLKYTPGSHISRSLCKKTMTDIFSKRS